jgi:hypothetical protein
LIAFILVAVAFIAVAVIYVRCRLKCGIEYDGSAIVGDLPAVPPEAIRAPNGRFAPGTPPIAPRGEGGRFVSKSAVPIVTKPHVRGDVVRINDDYQPALIVPPHVPMIDLSFDTPSYFTSVQSDPFSGSGGDFGGGGSSGSWDSGSSCDSGSCGGGTD